MADVIARGHGGDGAGDPPPPPGGGGGNHRMDLPEKKTRGKGKNLKLAKLVEENGGPLKLDFDVDYTGAPVGKISQTFTREAGNYMWASIPFDKRSWVNVDDAPKEAMKAHLSAFFDLGSDGDRMIQRSLEEEYLKTYRSRKGKAKDAFIQLGGYAEIEAGKIDEIKAKCPESMDIGCWHKAVDYFQTPEHKLASQRNKACREKQLDTNRGGSQKYCSAAYKNNKNRFEIFRDAKKKKDGTYEDPLIEEQAVALERAYNECTQAGNTPNEIEIFEKVLGSRRGHIRGIGRKPSRSCSFEKGQSSQSSQSSQMPKKLQEFTNMCHDPSFVAQLMDLMESYKKGGEGGGEDEDAQEDEDLE